MAGMLITSLLEGKGHFGERFLRSRSKECSCTIKEEIEANKQERDGEEG
jgi:hypothetical protein